jgi:hypothetical protein
MGCELGTRRRPLFYDVRYCLFGQADCSLETNLPNLEGFDREYVGSSVGIVIPNSGSQKLTAIAGHTATERRKLVN